MSFAAGARLLAGDSRRDSGPRLVGISIMAFNIAYTFYWLTFIDVYSPSYSSGQRLAYDTTVR